ncbi:Sterol 3-beta-glucosyltransferase [Batrachochytrium dendrobatidis]|nr:Sterol 3-beta-glucosyltransferase [Batrachochytrium dendrobatidis]
MPEKRTSVHLVRSGSLQSQQQPIPETVFTRTQTISHYPLNTPSTAISDSSTSHTMVASGLSGSSSNEDPLRSKPPLSPTSAIFIQSSVSPPLTRPVTPSLTRPITPSKSNWRFSYPIRHAKSASHQKLFNDAADSLAESHNAPFNASSPERLATAPQSCVTSAIFTQKGGVPSTTSGAIPQHLVKQSPVAGFLSKLGQWQSPLPWASPTSACSSKIPDSLTAIPTSTVQQHAFTSYPTETRSINSPSDAFINGLQATHSPIAPCIASTSLEPTSKAATTAYDVESLAKSEVPLYTNDAESVIPAQGCKPSSLDGMVDPTVVDLTRNISASEAEACSPTKAIPRLKMLKTKWKCLSSSIIAISPVSTIQPNPLSTEFNSASLPPLGSSPQVSLDISRMDQMPTPNTLNIATTENAPSKPSIAKTYWSRLASPWSTSETSPDIPQIAHASTEVNNPDSDKESCECDDSTTKQTKTKPTSGLFSRQSVQSLRPYFFRAGTNQSTTESVNNPLLHFAAAALKLAQNDDDESEVQNDNSYQWAGISLDPDLSDEVRFRDDRSSIHRMYFNTTQSDIAHEAGGSEFQKDNTIPESDSDSLSSVESFDGEDRDEDPNHQSHHGKKITSAKELGSSLSTPDFHESNSNIHSSSLTVAEKIQTVFELPETEPYRGEFACWLVRSVLLKGYMYLTSKHICFYASLYKSTRDIKSGFLKKRTTAKLYNTNWFVLKGNTFYAYGNSTELYYPLSTISMKSIVSVCVSKLSKTGFRIRTTSKKYAFEADTETLCNEWVAALRAAVFRSHNMGDDVRVVFPLSSISEISIAKSIGLDDSLRIKIVDSEFLISEEYYFAYFNDANRACDTLIALWESVRNEAKHNVVRKRVSLYDTTALTGLPSQPLDSHAKLGKQTNGFLGTTNDDMPATSSSSLLQSGTSLPALFRKSSVASQLATKAENGIAIGSVSNSPLSRPSLHHRAQTDMNLFDEDISTSYNQADSGSNGGLNLPSRHHKSSHTNLEKQQSSLTNINGLLSSGAVESLDKETPPFLSTLTPAKPDSSIRRNWWGHRKTISDGADAFGPAFSTSFNVLSKLDPGATTASQQQKILTFHKDFSVPETEILHATYSCYLDRVILRLGKIYISDHFLCFKSKVVGVRAKVMVPLSEIINIDISRKYTSLYYALVITTHTQEEIKFDFQSFESRKKIYNVLHKLLYTSSNKAEPNNDELSAHEQKAALLKDISLSETHVKSVFSQYEIAYIPPILDPERPIKLSEKMHITCLTIGTRGDVQPYIALCKAFMADGHTCRLATHLEYQDWIEGFGIEFRPVMGNPAELMQLCVDNGLFTVSFIREAMGKFRGWVDELLLSCWDAVQGTDLLIESPTAMGGIHCAEKMQIPYFSAFPMPWTRTKIYPHPFAVPEYHLGYGYNLMTHALIEHIFQKGVAPQVNRWRRQSLDMPTMNLGLLSEHKMPFLYSFSPSVVPPPPDWQDWIHTCGYWFLDNPEHDWEAPASLTKFMENGAKPIYIGFGSIVVPDPDALTRTIIEAVKKAGVRAILSKGWSVRLAKDSATAGQTETPIEYPDCIYPLDKVPHDWLFPLMAGVVHHGGAGTTAAGIRAGAPTLIYPFFGDQYFWADRVQDLGVGLSIRKLTVDKLASALVTLTTDHKMRERSALLGERVRCESGAANAVQYVYRDLEFAKQRIHELADRNKRHFAGFYH